MTFIAIIVIKELFSANVRHTEELMTEAATQEKCAERRRWYGGEIGKARTKLLEQGLDPALHVIVVANHDDRLGAGPASQLAPGRNWELLKKRDVLPIAVGPIKRSDLKKVLTVAAEAQLEAITGLAIVVIDFGTIEVTEA